MKILSVNSTNKYGNGYADKTNFNHQINLKKDNNRDTFTRSSAVSSPSFKQNIMTNPKMMAGYAAFVATAYAFMQKMMSGQKVQETADFNMPEGNLEDFSDFFVGMFNNNSNLKADLEKQTKAFEELKKQLEEQKELLELQKQINAEQETKIKELEKYNQDLWADLMKKEKRSKKTASENKKTTEATEGNNNATTGKKENDIKTEEPEQKYVKATFPKKNTRGNYPEPIRHLKALMLDDNMQFLPKTLTKLNVILSELVGIENNSKIKTTDKMELAKEFTENMKATLNNPEAADQYVNYFYSKLFPQAAGEKTAVVEETKTTEAKKPAKVRKHLSKIPHNDLSKKPAKNPDINKYALGVDIKYRNEQPSISLQANLKNVMNHVMTRADKKKIDGDITWQEKPEVPEIITPETVKQQINYWNSQKSNEKFVNITEGDAIMLAKIFNNDERYHQFFSIHGATRFIDRFADFGKTGKNFEADCRKKLDAYESLIKQAIADGCRVKDYPEVKSVPVTEGEPFDYINEQGIKMKCIPAYGYKMIIDTSKYKERDILGSLPIIVGVSFNKNNHGYVLVQTTYSMKNYMKG